MSKYISVVETAKLVREALKAAYPAIKFSVVSKSYSGGASIRVSWVDGPTSKDVDSIVRPFSGSDFDGMQDLKTSHTSELNGETVHFGADSVSTSREFTSEFLVKIARQICDKYGEPMPEIKPPGEYIGAYVVRSEPYRAIGGGYDSLDRLITNAAHETSAIPVGPIPAKAAPKSAGVTATWHDHQWVIAGDTYPHRQILRDAGARWNKPTQSWIISYDPEGVYYTMELPASIRAILTDSQVIVKPAESPVIPAPLIFEDGSHLEYPRDTIVIEPVQTEYYTYTMLNRPAGYGTCPEGRVVAKDVYHLMSEQAPNYGTVTYTRKLTPAELYKWEMAPESTNAYTFAVGDTAIRIETDEVCIVSGQLLRNRYLVEFDSYRWSVIEMDLHERELKADDRPIQGCALPDIAFWWAIDTDKKIVYLDACYTSSDECLAAHPGTHATLDAHSITNPAELWTVPQQVADGNYTGFVIVTYIPNTTAEQAETIMQAVTDWEEQNPETIPAQMSQNATCSLCGRSIPADLTICGTCQARKDNYEDRKQSRINRLQKRATNAAAESHARWERSHKMVEHIPMGQPILVGHHSEKRHRNLLAKVWNNDRKAYEAGKKAEYYTRRAAAAQSNHAISSDDPAALVLLREKLAKLEANQTEMKRINALVKKVLSKDKKQIAQLDADYKKAISVGSFRVLTKDEYKAYDDARSTYRATTRALYTSHASELAALAGITESQAIAFLTPDDLNRIGYPSYELTNNNANIRRIKERIADLEKSTQRLAQTAESDPQAKLYPHNAEVTENALENRLQIAFPGKPAQDIIKRLKQNGFHWSRTAGVWQRMLTPQAIASLRWILGEPIPETVEASPADSDSDYWPSYTAADLYPVEPLELSAVNIGEAAIARVLLNGERNNSTMILLGLYRNKRTGQLRLAFNNDKNNFPGHPYMSLILFADGGMIGAGPGYWRSEEWECIRPYTAPVKPEVSKPAQLSLL